MVCKFKFFLIDLLQSVLIYYFLNHLGHTRKKYKYNYTTLKFEEITRNRRFILGKALFFLLILSVVACIDVFLLYKIGSPKEITLSHKSEKLNELIEVINNQLDSVSAILSNNQFKDDNLYRIILEIDTIPKSIRDAGIGGSRKYRNLNDLNKAGLVIDVAQKIDKLYRQIDIQTRSFEYLVEMADENQKKIACIPSIQPVSVKDLTFISSYFGVRIDPFSKYQKPHYGLDFVAPMGTKIYATGDGIVTLSKYSRKGYGNEIIIDHNFGYNSRYAHLDKILIKEGQKVKRGQLIGLLGNTGRSTGPHLHYEIRYNNQPINPIYYYADEISEQEYERMIKQKKVDY